MRTEWGLVEPNAGYWQYGDTVAWRFTVPQDGVYQLSLEYSSQVEECPVQFWVDGVHAGNVKQQGTGGWDHYAMRPVALLSLKAGKHVIELNLGERGQSLNLRSGELARAEGEPLTFDETQVWLRPANVSPFAPNSPIRVEWLAEPPHFGFWTSGEKASWTLDLAKGGTFQSALTYATPTKGTRIQVVIDDEVAAEKELAETGDWSKFNSAEIGRIELAPGRHTVELIWDTPASFGAGNLRELKMQRLAQ
jgi:hypothetical protein